jgi:hypothetical protein
MNKRFNFDETQLIYLVVCAFVVITKKLLPNTLDIYTFFFLLGVLQFQTLHLDL